MSVKGIVLDETNESQIRACGFTDFAWDKEYDEMDEDDVELYQDWCNVQHDEIEKFSMDYMMGSEDAKIFYFSEEPMMVEHIAKTFPGCKVVTIPEQERKEDSS